jgi:hypothetical protein
MMSIQFPQEILLVIFLGIIPNDQMIVPGLICFLLRLLVLKIKKELVRGD